MKEKGERKERVEKRRLGNEQPFSLDGRISRVFNGATLRCFAYNHCSLPVLRLFSAREEEIRGGPAFRRESVYRDALSGVTSAAY